MHHGIMKKLSNASALFPLLLLDAFWDVIKGHNLFDNGCCDDIYDDDDDDSVH